MTYRHCMIVNWITILNTNLLPCESVPSSEFIQLILNSREGYIRQRISYGCKLYRLICEILTSVKSQLHLKHQTARVMHMRIYRMCNKTWWNTLYSCTFSSIFTMQFAKKPPLSRIDSITAKVLHMLPCTIPSTHLYEAGRTTMA